MKSEPLTKRGEDMNIKDNTFVLVIGQKDILTKPLWGIVISQYGDADLYNVAVSPFLVRKGMWQNFVIAKASELLVLFETDGSSTDPDKVFKHKFPDIIASGFALANKIAPSDTTSIQIGTLVVVQKDQELIWAIVHKSMPDTNLLVIVGKHLLRLDTTIVPPTICIPVIQTDGKTKSPKKAFLRNLKEITAKLTLVLHSLVNKAQT